MSDPSTVNVDVHLPDDTHVSLQLPRGDSIRTLDALLADHGYALNTRCAGRGLCRGCTLGLAHGTLLHKSNKTVAPATLPSCECRLDPASTAPMRLRIPARSLLVHPPQVEDAFVLKVPAAHNPLVPTNGNATHGFAIDIGTTTVVVLLVDLRDGRIVTRASALNAQVSLGDNVLTRIDHASQSPENLRRLQTKITGDTLVPLLRQALGQASLDSSAIAGATIAGNTAMLHLLTGTDPTTLGIAPFRPVFLEHRIHSSDTLGISLDEAATAFPIHLLPGLGAYVGADLNAGLAALGMAYRARPCLLVDVGTNGEIILQTPEHRLACATAAGPAFEGAGLDCGSRAVKGAVSAIELGEATAKVTLRTIGDGPPEQAPGICGSAYLDFLAEGRRTRLLNPYGRFEEDAWMRRPSPQQVQGNFGRALCLNPGAPRPLHISEADVASLLQAKAAIAAGIELLLHQARLQPAHVETLFLAGGFGRNLSVANALGCGLLPGFDATQIEVVGNTSLGGAYLCLLDAALVEELESFRATTTVIELNQLEDFEDTYLENLALP